MDRDILNNEASKIMAGFKVKMDKKNEKAREKAMKKWKKKHPNRPLEEFNRSVDAETSFTYGNSISGGNINNSEYLNRSNTYEYR